MNKKKNQKSEVSFESLHRPNQLKGNKVFPVVVSLFAVVLITVLSIIFINTEKKNVGKIDYPEYTTVTAAPGEEYKTKDEYGNEYIVKEDGMYCDTDFGLIKVEYNEPLEKYNTYTYTLYSGTIVTIDVFPNGTYKNRVVYADGSGYKSTGNFTMEFGIDNALSALNITNNQDFTDAFLFQTGAINPNDLFVLTLHDQEKEYFDQDWQPIEYSDEELEAFDEDSELESFGDKNAKTTVVQQKNYSDKLVIYLFKDKNDSEDPNLIQGVAYDINLGLLFNQNEINGTFSVAPNEQ